MAECGSWPTIETHELLSTTAILDRHRMPGEQRFALESQHRPEKILVQSPHFVDIVLRDQKPMSDSGLLRCLQDELTPQNWYEILNRKSFFWATRDRLSTLLNAGTYSNEEHDVLTIETAPLVHAYLERIQICHMNSGNTKPWPHPRGLSTFVSIENYQTKRNGNPLKPVAELVVDYGVPDIARYVVSVDRMNRDTVIRRLR